MIGKALVFAIAATLLASMIGKWMRPAPPRDKGPAIETARKCPSCGTYLIGPAPCSSPTCPSRRAS